MDFTTLGAFYSCIPINSLQVYSQEAVEVPYKQVVSFRSYFQDGLGRPKGVLSLGSVTPTAEAIPSCEFYE